jgi:hypothetical protein
MLTERSSIVLLTSKLDSSFTVEIPSTLVIKQHLECPHILSNYVTPGKLFIAFLLQITTS